MAEGIGDFFKGIFSKEKKNASTRGKSVAGWSHYVSEDGKVTQVVLSFPPSSVQVTQLSTVELPPEKFPVLAMGSWCVGFSCVNSEKFLMFKADGFIEEIKQYGITVALSFCKMPSQGLMKADIRVESEEIRPRVTMKYEHVPRLEKPVGQWVSGINSLDMELIPGVLSGKVFRVVLARNETFSRKSILLPDGGVMQTHMPVCEAELHFEMSDELRELLVKSWSDLVSYDDSIPSYQRNFQIALASELSQYFPADRDPILKEP